MVAGRIAFLFIQHCFEFLNTFLLFGNTLLKSSDMVDGVLQDDAPIHFL